MHVCENCNKTFTTKYTLKTHLERNKKCIISRGIEITSNFICKSCNHISMKNSDFQIHLSNCTKYIIDIAQKSYDTKLIEKDKEISLINQIVSDQKETIKKLEAKLEKFENILLDSKTEKKPITTNNTTNNNIVINNNSLNLNDIPKMTAFLEEKMDKDVVAGGQKGLALLLTNTVLKDKYKCVDPSRQNFEFTNELGEVERDVKAKKLTNALIKSDICAKAGERGIQLWKKEDGSTDSLRHDAHSKKVLEMIMFSQDNSTFRSELSALTS
jgi:hypothetical protein